MYFQVDGLLSSFFSQPKENTEKGQPWDMLCGCTVHSHHFAWFEMISQGSTPKWVKYYTLIHKVLVYQGKCSTVKLWHCIGTWNRKGANVPFVYKTARKRKEKQGIRKKTTLVTSWVLLPFMKFCEMLHNCLRSPTASPEEIRAHMLLALQTHKPQLVSNQPWIK